MFEIKRTMQPETVDLTKLRYPCDVSVKLDGVKCVRFNEALRGRSFKQYRNRHLNEIFDKPEFEGFEGEIVVGYDVFAADLCRKTTSAVNSFEGQPIYGWILYDYVTEETVNLPYWQRIAKLDEHLNTLPVNIIPQPNWIQIAALYTVENESQLLDWEERFLAQGAEGLIVRDRNSLYKQGRCTVNSQECLRLKRFDDAECYIIGFNEKMHNENEATVNELGLTTRSSHQDNLVGTGTLGSLNVIDCKTGIEFSIGTGFDDELRQEIWNNQDKYRGAIVKYKFFNKGVKELPRFPVFLSFRSEVDTENDNVA